MSTDQSLAQLVAPTAAKAGIAQQLAASLAQLKVPITNDAELERAAQWVQQLAVQRKEWAEELETGLKPLRLVMDTMRSWFPLAAVDDVVVFLKGAMQGYRATKKAIAAAALVQARTQTEVAQSSAALVGPPPSGFHERDNWTFEIVDANAVPREWWVLDEKRLAAHVRANKDKTNIPGIRVVNERGLARNPTR